MDEYDDELVIDEPCACCCPQCCNLYFLCAFFGLMGWLFSKIEREGR